jgi:hypothetical protein
VLNSRIHCHFNSEGGTMPAAITIAIGSNIIIIINRIMKHDCTKAWVWCLLGATTS